MFDYKANRHQSVMLSLLCESYANAIERLVVLNAKSSLEKWLLSINTYIDPNSYKPMLYRSQALLGLQRALTLGIFVFLKLNRGREWSQDDTWSVVSKVASDDTNTSPVECLALEYFLDRLGEDLNSRFIQLTTPFFFALSRCEKQYSEISTGDGLTEEQFELQIEEAVGHLVSVTCCALSATASIKAMAASVFAYSMDFNASEGRGMPSEARYST